MGANAGQLQTASTATQGLTAAGNAYVQSNALQVQGEYQKQQYDMNARLAELQASDAIRRGEKGASTRRTMTKQMIGSQRAALAAQGIDINKDSALDVQADTAAIGAEDELTIRNNAWREAWGYRVSALNNSYQGQFAQAAANNASRNTLLTGGMEVLGYGYKAGYQYANNRPSKKET